MTTSTYKIVLAGNPNSGKSSLFNALTGLHQKVGNFPGVTVDKKTGKALIGPQLPAQIIDLPGTYSLYPKSPDEYVAYDLLLHAGSRDTPDLVLVVADASNLRRSLLFCSQVMDLDYPVILVLTMMDIAQKEGVTVNVNALSGQLGVPVVVVNPRSSNGLDQLKKTIVHTLSTPPVTRAPFVLIPEFGADTKSRINRLMAFRSDYALLHIASNFEKINFLDQGQKAGIDNILHETGFSKSKAQAGEIMSRYARIDHIIKSSVVAKAGREKNFSEKLDSILLHKLWGNVALVLVMFLMFQCVFWLAEYPMNWIESSFSWLQGWAAGALPETWWADFLVNGLMAGLGGVVIFVPQIALLFGIITILEDTGYMARVSFLTDRIMRAAGLNGRSVMPLVSGMACAIPAVMAARTIENPKERLITIMVTPFMSCSARLPIYIILIALVIPDTTYWGFLKLQALVMTGMYFLGLFMALLVAKVLSWIIRNKGNSIFLMELPVYRMPRWKNALLTMYEKAKIFITDAGKVIMVISLVLWLLTTYGPSGKMAAIEQRFEQLKAVQNGQLTTEQEEQMLTEKQEQSFAGMLGKVIEPAIRPLGYDWKMGIALITSFAAREVFVGTMATLYSVGDADENSATLREKMACQRRADGTKVYTLATGVSLMVFYAFAMQCMSTLAIVRRETKSWKWPLIQLLYMTGIAYLAALLAYQLLK